MDGGMEGTIGLGSGLERRRLIEETATIQAQGIFPFLFVFPPSWSFPVSFFYFVLFSHRCIE